MDDECADIIIYYTLNALKLGPIMRLCVFTHPIGGQVLIKYANSCGLNHQQVINYFMTSTLCMQIGTL